MNRTITAILAIGFFSAVAQANTAVKARPAEKVKPGRSAIEVAPSAKANTGVIPVGEAAKAAGASCSVAAVAQALSSNGSRASFADAEKAVASGLLKNGGCGNGLTGFDGSARENAVETIVNVIRNGDAAKTGADLKLALAKGLSEALANDKDGSRLAPESLLPAVDQLQTKCGIFASK